MTEYILLILYFSAFICLCALVCLYFSGCQEMTYKHDGKDSVGFENVDRNKEVNKHRRPDLISSDLLCLVFTSYRQNVGE
ncbi:uncharacterized protein LOC142963044 [Anarhichas minor]|uniref:uncharacterized protein LOC142963044 n=1 Tax=Anarhichas minor TaxID=65739 RepID=UPI003F7392BF